MGSQGYLLAPVVVATAALILVVLVVQGGYRDASRRVFLVVLGSLFLWAASTFFMRASQAERAATIWNRVVAVSLLGLFVTFSHFCHRYIGRTSRWPVALGYSLAAAFAAVVLFTNLAVPGVERASYGWSPRVGPAGVGMFASVALLIVLSVVRLLRAWRRELSAEKRRRLFSLSITGILPLLGIFADGFTDLPPVLIWANLALCAVCAVAIIRYRLLDLRVIARRGLVRLLVGTLIAIPFVAGTLAASWYLRDRESTLVVFAVAMLAYILVMWPAYEWARWRVERLLASERFDHLQELRELARSADSLGGSRQTACRLTSLVQRALNASSVALLEPQGDAHALCLAARNGTAGVAAEPVIGAASPVVQWLQRRRTTLSTRALAVEPLLQNIPQSEKAALSEMHAEHPRAAAHDAGAALGDPRARPQGLAPAILHRRHRVARGPRGRGGHGPGERTPVPRRRAGPGNPGGVAEQPARRGRHRGQGRCHPLPQQGGHRAARRRPGQRSFLRTAPPSEAGQPQRFTETIRGREYEIASAPLVEPGGELSSVFVMRDVTERRQEQERREQLEARARLASHLASIGEMASGIAHEINNPLTAVIGYSQLLGALPLPDEALDAARQIQQGSQRVAGIVQRLLTFARQRKPQRTEVDMNEVVRSTVALRDYALRTGNIHVTMTLDPALPRTVADGQQMQQVLLNLIVNAEAAMSGARGRGDLSISTETRGSVILVSVRDDGPGIPPEIQERIFDPFFTTREVGQGTGLGLSICHGIVSEHGGRIWVQSEPGQGAAFHVRIPIVAAGQAAPAAEAARPGSSGPRTRVLVVDDEPSIRALLTVLLQKQGHEVDAVSEGEAAVKSVASRRYGVILLDVRMPDMSGLEVFLRIKEIAESIASRVIFITGDVMADETRGLLAKTGAPAIAKPFQADELLAAIEKILKGRAD